MALVYPGPAHRRAHDHRGRLCSTVPSVLREMRTMIARYWDDLPAVIVEPGTKTGVPLLTDNPKEVGADRIVNTLAAHHLFGGPAIVVDFGTSTNLDVISPRATSSAARWRRASRSRWTRWPSAPPSCARWSWSGRARVIGKNTVEALQSGALYGFAGQVDGLVDRIIAELGGASPPSSRPADWRRSWSPSRARSPTTSPI